MVLAVARTLPSLWLNSGGRALMMGAGATTLAPKSLYITTMVLLDVAVGGQDTKSVLRVRDNGCQDLHRGDHHLRHLVTEPLDECLLHDKELQTYCVR